MGMRKALADWLDLLNDPVAWVAITLGSFFVVVGYCWRVKKRLIDFHETILTATLMVGVYGSFDLIWNVAIQKKWEPTPERLIWIVTIAAMTLIAVCKAFYEGVARRERFIDSGGSNLQPDVLRVEDPDKP